MGLHTLKGHMHIQGSADTSEWITYREQWVEWRSWIKGKNKPERSFAGTDAGNKVLRT